MSFWASRPHCGLRARRAKVAEVGPEDTDEGGLVARMVGHTIQLHRKRRRSRGRQILRVNGLRASGVLEDVSLHVNRGEIVGLAGLAGAGRTETVRAIVGADKTSSGTVFVDGGNAASGRRTRSAAASACFPKTGSCRACSSNRT